MSFLILAALAAQPAELKVFSDWIVGCDNGKACHATSLDGNSYDSTDKFGNVENVTYGDGDVAVSIERAAGGRGPIGVDIFMVSELKGSTRPDPASITIDGKPAPFPFTMRDGKMIFANGADRAVVTALMEGSSLELFDKGGMPAGSASLMGLTAALRYMDEQQGRLGTVTAFVEKGTKPEGAVPRPPALPIVKEPIGSSKPERILSAVPAQKERQFYPCRTPEPFMQKKEIEYYRLDTALTLALLPAFCGTGAYNASVKAILIDERGKILPAKFEFPVDAEAPDLLINSWWDRKNRTLSSYQKARGLGDCGERQTYAWDGKQFRLIEAKAMSECRGSLDYITTWRAIRAAR